MPIKGFGMRVPGSSMARPEGFEPPTNWFEASYSIQLSYGRLEGRDDGMTGVKASSIRPADPGYRA